jgi:UDP-2-acetamido-2,6-beta-L-arabino-hexul-4-ose reductase
MNDAILVTGARGFVGKNLVQWLMQEDPQREVLSFDLTDSPARLREYVSRAGFVFHLAGVNRPQDPGEFDAGNRGFTQELLDLLLAQERPVPVVLSSSIQAEWDNPYGKSKLAAEEAVFAYGERTGAPVYVYRLPNLFGKWCRPNYNSVVATFCYNIARGLPVTVNDPSARLSLVYIDDLCREFLRALMGRPHQRDRYCGVYPEYPITVADLELTIRFFAESRENRLVPHLDPDGLTAKLYAAYLSYLPEDGFAYPLLAHADERGSFTEFLRTPERGQVSVNVSRPGVTKGNHWHHTKNEKFLVVKGEGLIRFRRIGAREVMEYRVSGDQPTVVDIPTGYTHSIVNVGQEDLVTVMWASECFDPLHPDTFYEEV